MSAERTSSRLVLSFPRRWRERYGEELEALIVEASGGGRVPWPARLDVARAGGRERFRAAGLGGGEAPPERLRGGVLLALCAWAVFVLGGLIVAKFSEHWQDSLPAGGGSGARLAYGAIVAGAGLASAATLLGAALAVPTFLRFVRGDGWAAVARPLRRAALVSALLAVATVALVVWAGGLGAHARDGGDGAYAAAFLAWALLVAIAILAWAAAAVRIASLVELPPRVLRAEAWLAGAVAIAMAAVAAATIAWWIAVADLAPAFLRGGEHAGSALAPQLLVAVALMALATPVACRGAWRALRELPRLDSASSSSSTSA